MFGLAASILEILYNATTRLLDKREVSRDGGVARALLELVLLLQEISVRGNRILGLARRFADRTADDATAGQFDQALQEQVATLTELRTAVAGARPLLATVDPAVYLQLAPFLDAKSGLLTRWEQQRRTSGFSTTTLFFLDHEAIDRVAATGREGATVDGLAADRADLVMAIADTIRQARTTEVRDIRRLDEAQSVRLLAEIGGAQTDLDRAGELCVQLLASIEAAVGSTGMASLRRDLLKGSRG
ncbi:hypothetical protein QEZ54_11780 [Catellatospora sp. KI3]|uniref:hypothetical protein n=1 Tax=Catellatospora sp. KI3 TaxID=3041620 RepID=UPI0024830310|nr:hypothetical protein [Catellatospora sp. KI3]MDI1461654.1 hypothetical protein [Catellatospora sp. KI3]